MKYEGRGPTPNQTSLGAQGNREQAAGEKSPKPLVPQEVQALPVPSPPTASFLVKTLHLGPLAWNKNTFDRSAQRVASDRPHATRGLLLVYCKQKASDYAALT